MHGRRCGCAGTPSTQRACVAANPRAFDRLAWANSDSAGNSNGCGRDNFLRELGRVSLEPKDLIANVNFLMYVPVDEDGDFGRPKAAVFGVRSDPRRAFELHRIGRAPCKIMRSQGAVSTDPGAHTAVFRPDVIG